MLGAIYGDKAGSIHEYEQIKTIKPVEVEQLIQDNSFYSDDTIETIAVIDAIVNNKDYGRLVLATSFPVFIRKEDVCMISFFNLVRLDYDEMTINFETVDVATVELVMKEVDDLL